MAKPKTDLFKFACEFAATPSARITAKNLNGQYEAATVTALITAKALVQAPHSQDIDVVINDEDRSYAVGPYNGGMAYFSPVSGWTPVENDDLRVYRIDFDWLLRGIAGALEIPANVQSQVIIECKAWFLGSARLNKRKTPVIFARLVTDRDVAKTLREYLQEHHASDPALVLTNTANVPSYFQLPGQNRLVAIADALDFESTTLAFKMPYLAGKMGSTVAGDGFSNGYRTLQSNGQTFSFSTKKASALEIMDKAGIPMHQHEIMAQPDSAQDRLIDLFRNDPAWKVIFKTDGKGNYWLDY
jgi:hypothetical protein